MLCNEIEINESERLIQTIETKINESELLVQTRMIIHIFVLLSESYIQKKSVAHICTEFTNSISFLPARK